jgi:hypothetical protein
MSREEWNEYRLERDDEIRARFDDRAIDTGAEFGRAAGAGIDPLSSFYDLGAVAHYHDQPPFETPARTWLSARSITGDTTVEDLLEIPPGGWIVDGVKILHPDAYSDWQCWLNHVRRSITKIDRAFAGKNFGVGWYLPTIMALNAKYKAPDPRESADADGCQEGAV